MPIENFAADAARLFDADLAQMELRRIKRGDLDEANPTAPIESEAVETYLAKGYIRRKQARDANGRAIDGSQIVIYAASMSGLLGRRTVPGQVVNPWSAAFDSSFGGSVPGQDYVPDDLTPREGDRVRFMGETARHTLGLLIESDASAARLVFAVNLNTN